MQMTSPHRPIHPSNHLAPRVGWLASSLATSLAFPRSLSALCWLPDYLRTHAWFRALQFSVAWCVANTRERDSTEGHSGLRPRCVVEWKAGHGRMRRRCHVYTCALESTYIQAGNQACMVFCRCHWSTTTLATLISQCVLSFCLSYALISATWSLLSYD